MRLKISSQELAALAGPSLLPGLTADQLQIFSMSTTCSALLAKGDGGVLRFSMLVLS